MSKTEESSDQLIKLDEVDEARVGWVELFYDLVVVAWLAHTNVLALKSHEGSLIFLIVGAGFFLYMVWMTMATINSKFPSSAASRRLIMFAQMFLMLIAMLSFDPEGLSTTHGVIAISLIFLLCAIAYLDVGIRIPEVRKSTFWSAGAAVLGGLICLTAIFFVPDEVRSASKAVPFTVAGAIVLGIPLLWFYSHKAQGKYRIQLHHLDERWGQLTLITLGESFLLFSEELSGLPTIPNVWMFFLSFVTIVAIWRLYFDSAMRRPYDTPPTSRHYYALIFAQFFIILGIISIIDALVESVSDLEENVVQITGLLIVGSLVLFLALAWQTWGRRGRVEGVVAIHLVVALIIGHWIQFFFFWDENLTDEVFVAGICLIIICYAMSIKLIDKHATRIFQSKLPIDSWINRSIQKSSAGAEAGAGTSTTAGGAQESKPTTDA